jgi:hypothetical protein
LLTAYRCEWRAVGRQGTLRKQLACGHGTQQHSLVLRAAACVVRLLLLLMCMLSWQSPSGRGVTWHRVPVSLVSMRTKQWSPAVITLILTSCSCVQQQHVAQRPQHAHTYVCDRRHPAHPTPYLHPLIGVPHLCSVPIGGCWWKGGVDVAAYKHTRHREQCWAGAADAVLAWEQREFGSTVSQPHSRISGGGERGELHIVHLHCACTLVGKIQTRSDHQNLLCAAGLKREKLAQVGLISECFVEFSFSDLCSRPVCERHAFHGGFPCTRRCVPLSALLLPWPQCPCSSVARDLLHTNIKHHQHACACTEETIPTAQIKAAALRTTTSKRKQCKCRT